MSIKNFLDCEGQEKLRKERVADCEMSLSGGIIVEEPHFARLGLILSSFDLFHLLPEQTGPPRPQGAS